MNDSNEDFRFNMEEAMEIATQAVHRALAMHKLLGVPTVIMEDGQIKDLHPDEIPQEYVDELRAYLREQARERSV